ncbi:MAG TPA: alpha/beta family hydrolase [Thermoanaerobaculia bacterium]|nr:alpha/beta family hydrolase [Thermoanaerobaculia bacterium]
MPRELRFQASRSAGEVSALYQAPPDTKALYVLAHGAGGGMRSSFLEVMASRLAERGVGTFRYQFPYMENRRPRTDAPAVAVATVRAAVAAATEAMTAEGRSLPLIAGGKSFGGRMTAYAAADKPLAGVRGLALLGFPLHAPNSPATGRWEPMPRVRLPMLFLQGTRDALADLGLLRPLVEALEPRATLHVIAGADHSFKVTKKATGRTGQEVLDELADTLASWALALPDAGQKRLF